jgi:hypothetical protein
MTTEAELMNEVTELLIEHVRLSLVTLEQHMRAQANTDMSAHEPALFAIEDKAMDLVVLAGLAKRRKEAGL